MKAVTAIVFLALLTVMDTHHEMARFPQTAKSDPPQKSTEVVAQWGGPARNFRYPATELSDTWKNSGPQVLWKRDLGGGYAGISVCSGRVYTTIRQAEQEFDIALDATTGKTIWSFSIDVPEQDLDYGMGPFATPLVTDDQVIMLGGSGVLRSRNMATGKLKWRLDFSGEYETWEPDGGYASSPLLVDGMLIIQVGSKQASIVAVDAKTGKPVWARHDFKTDYASPVAIPIGDETQVICHMEDEVIGIDPLNGDLNWRVASQSAKTQHVIAPVEIGGDKVIASATYGLNAYRITEEDPQLIWESKRIRAQVGNLIFLPDEAMLIGAAGAATGSPIVALDANDGRLLWKSRSMECGFLWQIGQRLFCLSRSGELVQGIANREGLEILGKHQVFDETKVWSAPGISGSLLVVKNQEQIVAFDLAK